MIPEIEAILRDEFTAIRDEIVEKYYALKMAASENLPRDMTVKAEGLTVTLFGPHYIEQLVNGREPGKFPPLEKIEQWILDKPIPLPTYIVQRISGPVERSYTVSGLAFVIARKIAEEGTRYFQQGGTDLVDSIVTPERIQGIIDRVSVFYIDFFVQGVTNTFKQLSQAA